MLDPWLFCLHKEILNGEIKPQQPILAINSEEWHEYIPGFDSWETLHHLFYHSNGAEDLNVMIKETGHLFQTDVLSLAPLEFKMWTGRNPSNEVVEMYELANKVATQWLKDLGFPEIVIKEHSQISPYFEKKSIEVLNRPDENEAEGEEEEEEKKTAVGDDSQVNDSRDALKPDEDRA